MSVVNNQQALQIGELWARVVQSKYGGWQGMLEADRAGWEEGAWSFGCYWLFSRVTWLEIRLGACLSR